MHSRTRTPAQAPSQPQSPAPRAANAGAPAQLAYFVIFNPTLAAKKPKAENVSSNEVKVGERREEGEEGGEERPQGTEAEAGTDKPQNADQAPEAATKEETSSAKVPADPAREDPGERDRDLEDDLREAAQIVFYTSREAGGVSRDTMLRQVGLAKGLMGFSDMVEPSSEPFWAVHSQNTRLIIFTPEPDWFIYIGVKLAMVQPDPKKDEVTPAQGLSDRMLLDILQRGYDDFLFLHGTFGSHLPASSNSFTRLEKYWTRFAFSFEATYLSPSSPGFLTWLGGYAAPPAPPLNTSPLEKFAEEHLEPGRGIGLVGRDGPLASTRDVPNVEASPREAAAFMRYLVTTLTARLPVERDPPVVLPTKSTTDRQTLGFGFGRRKHAREAVVPTKEKEGKEKDPKEEDDRKSSWGPLSWVGLGSTPSSRTVTPSPGDKPGKVESNKPSVAIPAAPRKTHTPSGSTSSSIKSRWPSLGFGDVMGNMGAALGLSTAPNPPTDGAEGKATSPAGPETEGKEATNEGDSAEDESTPNDDAAPKEGEDTCTPKAEDIDIGVGSGHSHDAETNPADVSGTSADTSEVDMLGTSTNSRVSIALTNEAGSSFNVPLDDEDDQVTDGTPTVIAAADDETDAETAVSDGPGATAKVDPVALPVVEAEVGPEIAAAKDDRVDVTWSSKNVFVGGRNRRLNWVVRDCTLLYVLDPSTEYRDPPSASATVDLFKAMTPEPPRAPPTETASLSTSLTASVGSSSDKIDDTTIYHRAGVTESSSKTVSDNGTLSTLRDILLAPTGPNEVYAQAPSTRFAVAKKAEGELYVLTGRKEASLTEAERAVRAYAFVRPEFS